MRIRDTNIVYTYRHITHTHERERERERSEHGAAIDACNSHTIVGFWPMLSFAFTYVCVCEHLYASNSNVAAVTAAIGSNISERHSI